MSQSCNYFKTYKESFVKKAKKKTTSLKTKQKKTDLLESSSLRKDRTGMSSYIFDNEIRKEETI
jgi:hypothetical protein